MEGHRQDPGSRGWRGMGPQQKLVKADVLAVEKAETPIKNTV